VGSARRGGAEKAAAATDARPANVNFPLLRAPPARGGGGEGPAAAEGAEEGEGGGRGGAPEVEKGRVALNSARRMEKDAKS